MINLAGIIKSIQNIMREDGGVDGDAQRLSQLCWMLFLKIFDEKEEERELLEENYQSPLQEKLRWRNWAKDKEGITGESLISFINDELFPALKSLSFTKQENESGYVIQNIFADSYNYMKNGTQIRKVINKINEINFNRKADQDEFGVIYESLLASLQSAGNAGEYYTPRALTQFITEMINPKLEEKILDPACGTGGFLTSVIEYIRKKDVHTPEEEEQIKQTVKGIEFKQLPHMLCTTNMILHGIAAPTNITRDDTLAKPIKDIEIADKVDVIVANPPFGGSVADGIVANFPKSYQTKETADLFLVLFIELLKEEGRAGIVLPDGSLTGDGVKERIRENWLKKCNLHTIIRLPNSVFAPYATVATNLIFFTKGEPTKEIWYYEHRLPEGQKSYSKTKPIRVEEFEPIKKWWKNRKESEFCWKVSIAELEKRKWDLDIKNPNQKEEEKEWTTDELIEKLENSFGEVKNILEEIKGEV